MHKLNSICYFYFITATAIFDLVFYLVFYLVFFNLLLSSRVLFFYQIAFLVLFSLWEAYFFILLFVLHLLTFIIVFVVNHILVLARCTIFVIVIVWTFQMGWWLLYISKYRWLHPSWWVRSLMHVLGPWN